MRNILFLFTIILSSNALATPLTCLCKQKYEDDFYFWTEEVSVECPVASDAQDLECLGVSSFTRISATCKNNANGKKTERRKSLERYGDPRWPFADCTLL